MTLNNKIFITDMDCDEARLFFLKKDSYFSVNLPTYFNFNYLLDYSIKLIGNERLNKKPHLLQNPKYYKIPDINYILQMNKTKESFRPMSLIHPLLYVDLVNLLTEKENWELLINRYKELKRYVQAKITCESIPFEITNFADSSKYAFHFWERIEQESLILSLEYNKLLSVDISNFYGSIYTHIIPWAIHGEEQAKNDRSNSLLGNEIDKTFRFMNYGETVGIPQGNVISDFVSELILAYLDLLLFERLEELNLEYKILRYRDDYRIFTSDKRTENTIKKELVLILQRHKLSLGESKTKSSSEIIVDSIKQDKLYWIEHNPVMTANIDLKQKEIDIDTEKINLLIPQKLYKTSIQKHLLIIKMFADKFPNSGQLIKAIFDFEHRILDLTSDELLKNGADISVLIAIVFNLIENNPKITANGVKLLSILFSKEINEPDRFEYYINIPFLKNDTINKKFERINSIIKRIATHSINSYLEIWLQRLVIKVLKESSYFTDDYISNSVNYFVRITNEAIRNNDISTVLFNEEWIKEEYRINWLEFIDFNEINNLSDTIKIEEIKDFEYSNFI